MFAAALAASLLVQLLRRAESVLAPKVRRYCIRNLSKGNDIEVVLPGDVNTGRIGRIVESLSSSDEFDVVVTFDESPANVYVYRHRELKPVVSMFCQSR